MSGRRALKALACSAFLLAMFLLSGCSSAIKLGGTPLDSTPAPDFTLTDSAGRTFSLHDYRGKAVAITFLYTHCPDICPAVAGNLSIAAHDMGSRVSGAAFIVVSVDPQHDTPASVDQFTSEHDLGWLGLGWRYGLGDQAQLAQVWNDYGIGVAPLTAAQSSPQLVAAGYLEVTHEAVLYLIDKRGRERAVLEYDATAQQIAKDLKALAAE